MRRILLSLSSLIFVGCYQGQPSQDAPMHVNPNMDQQERYDPQSTSNFFGDGATMRVPPVGTVAQGHLNEDSVYFTGMAHDTIPVKLSPVPTTAKLLLRGRERFDIYCAPCHSKIGDGKGMTIQRGLNPPPPSFHDERLLLVGDGHIFNVITNGIRNMAPYKYQIPVADRWAIVAYFRALQRSQNATAQDIPVSVRGTLK